MGERELRHADEVAREVLAETELGDAVELLGVGLAEGELGRADEDARVLADRRHAGEAVAVVHASLREGERGHATERSQTGTDAGVQEGPVVRGSRRVGRREGLGTGHGGVFRVGEGGGEEEGEGGGEGDGFAHGEALNGRAASGLTLGECVLPPLSSPSRSWPSPRPCRPAPSPPPSR